MGILSFLFGTRKNQLVMKNFRTEKEPARIIRTKVVGVTFKNNDGSNRQKIIQECKNGDTLYLVKQPIKGYPHAIAVYNNSNEQLGHISDDLATDISSSLNKKYIAKVKIIDILGGTKDKPTLGCGIEIKLYKII